MSRPIVQAIAALLIIQRVANKSALTSNTVASGHLSSFKFGSRGQSTGDSDLPYECPMSSLEGRGVGSGELGVRTTIDVHQGKVSEPP